MRGSSGKHSAASPPAPRRRSASVPCPLHCTLVSSTNSLPHCVAVIGGAVAAACRGGEARSPSAASKSAVFEQNRRPYGKIEDAEAWPALARAPLRRRSTRRSARSSRCRTSRSSRSTEIGRDVGFRELTDEWGLHGRRCSPNGAWRDRPLPIEGADAYVGRGLIYQNPFIIWFNHSDEPGYRGPGVRAARRRARGRRQAPPRSTW